MINGLREICGILPVGGKEVPNLFILTFWIIGFGLGGWLYTFGLKKNIKWIKICSVIYFGFGILGMALLFVWGTGLLRLVSAQHEMIFKEIIPSSEKIFEETNKIREENEKLKKEIKQLKSNQNTHGTENLKQENYQRGAPYKMFPNTQREGAYEILVTNNKVVIARFHGLGVESHVTVPEKIQGMPVTIIGKWSFSRIIRKSGEKNPDILVKVSLPETLEKIESGAFYMNNNLSEINFPSKIHEIEDSTFAFCGFTNLVLPNTVKKIGKSAFLANLRLYSVAIPSSVEFIGEEAFSRCLNLKNIEMSGTNTVIEADAFQYCPNQPASTPTSTNPQ